MLRPCLHVHVKSVNCALMRHLVAKDEKAAWSREAISSKPEAYSCALLSYTYHHTLHGVQHKEERLGS